MASRAIHHVMSRGDRREDMYKDDVDRQDFFTTFWKLQIAARLRRETILTIKSIAGRLGMGTSKSANVNLHAWTQKDDQAKRNIGQVSVTIDSFLTVWAGSAVLQF